MFRNASRLLDKDSHGDVMITGSPNVYTNNRRAIRVGDIDNCIDHDRSVTGSPNVFINNRKAVRIRDIDTDRDRMITGSPDTFINR